ncbi:hypothetical protein BsWGS_25971 [Bradybaena similaris]
MIYKYAIFVIFAVVSADTGDDQKLRRGFVGFYVTLNETTYLTPGETVKYNNVITNAGNHYNPYTGVFTAPRTAYYLFRIDALCNGPYGFSLQLIHNETPRASYYSTITSDSWSTGGSSALLKVNAGEKVYVKVVINATNLYGDGTHHINTFTCHLVGR